MPIQQTSVPTTKPTVAPAMAFTKLDGTGKITSSVRAPPISAARTGPFGIASIAELTSTLICSSSKTKGKRMTVISSTKSNARLKSKDLGETEPE